MLVKKFELKLTMRDDQNINYWKEKIEEMAKYGKRKKMKYVVS